MEEKKKPAQSTVYKVMKWKKPMSWELLNSTATQVLLFILSNMLLVKQKQTKKNKKKKKKP